MIHCVIDTADGHLEYRLIEFNSGVYSIEERQLLTTLDEVETWSRWTPHSLCLTRAQAWSKLIELTEGKPMTVLNGLITPIVTIVVGSVFGWHVLSQILLYLWNF